MDIKKIYWVSYVKRHGAVRSRVWTTKHCYKRFLTHIATSPNYFLISFGSCCVKWNREALKEAMK